MGGMENLYAGLAGAAQGTTDIMKMLTEYNLKKRQKEQDLLAEEQSKMRMFEKTLPMETAAKLQIAQQMPYNVIVGYDENNDPIFEQRTGGRPFAPPIRRTEQSLQVPVKTTEQLRTIAETGGTTSRGTVEIKSSTNQRGQNAPVLEKRKLLTETLKERLSALIDSVNYQNLPIVQGQLGDLIDKYKEANWNDPEIQALREKIPIGYTPEEKNWFSSNVPSQPMYRKRNPPVLQNQKKQMRPISDFDQ